MHAQSIKVQRVCQYCGASFLRYASQGKGLFCSRPCVDAAKVQDVATRFWSKVDKSSDCWFWTAGIGTDGYGKFWLNGRTIHAQCAAYELTYGPITPGHSVLHRCDTPACVRPDHLFTGTPRDNTHDMISKGRMHYGENHRGSKLTADAVRAIRTKHSAGVPLAELAAEYGVSKSRISAIGRGHGWAHL